MFSINIIACDSKLCSNLLLEEKISPDGKFIASIFERNCGATTPSVYVVSFRLSSAKIDLDNFDDWVFTIHGQSKLKARWEKNDELTIFYSNTGDNPTQRKEWKGIKVSYKKE